VFTRSREERSGEDGSPGGWGTATERRPSVGGGLLHPGREVGEDDAAIGQPHPGQGGGEQLTDDAVEADKV
jgi:hypothetical protein